jgi:hypothetical protein
VRASRPRYISDVKLSQLEASNRRSILPDRITQERYVEIGRGDNVRSWQGESLSREGDGSTRDEAQTYRVFQDFKNFSLSC